MILDMNAYTGMINDLNINIIYSGPMWADGLKGLAEMVKAHLEVDDVPGNAAKSVFSVFVEQVTNMLMYSAGKERYPQPDNETFAVSTGLLVLGHKEKMYFIQTRNAIKNQSINLIKSRIDHLNTLDKKELRKFYKEQMRADNDNPESQGAGLGLIEIARRATAPIEYKFDSINNELSHFTMYVEIAQGGAE
ncbi:MAG: SiaB family protein kinase [Defluviitaleaceae bacterium]|nr:SiaB family protein kinase [Defluviitaleaceae bacterium]MCL2837228.1 SiaB family protein kinase [Defluviitaleaceae bacterium]